MEQEKIAKIIKDIRLKNKLTQAEFAEKYSVTYQAVSKWETGKNLPDMYILKKICNDYNINIDDLLNGEIKKKKNNKKIIILASILFLVTLIILLFIIKKDNSSFIFKTLSTTCNDFNVTGSIAYDNSKSSIYISDINYCGEEDDTLYKDIKCNLFEVNSNSDILINSCNAKSNVKLEDYLKDIKLNIDNYEQSCKNYTNDSLYLEISATNSNNKTTIFKVPLILDDNCNK